MDTNNSHHGLLIFFFLFTLMETAWSPETMECFKTSCTKIMEEILECALRLIISFPPFLPHRTDVSQTIA